MSCFTYHDLVLAVSAGVQRESGLWDVLTVRIKVGRIACAVRAAAIRRASPSWRCPLVRAKWTSPLGRIEVRN